MDLVTADVPYAGMRVRTNRLQYLAERFMPYDTLEVYETSLMLFSSFFFDLQHPCYEMLAQPLSV